MSIRCLGRKDRSGSVALKFVIFFVVLAGGMFLTQNFLENLDRGGVPASKTITIEGGETALQGCGNPEADESDPENPYKGKILSGNCAVLLDFQKSDYDLALSKPESVIVLYFYASWCPICRAEFPKMQEAFLGVMNKNVVGFRVNYKDSDTDSDEIDLARKFGITYQHTKVILKGGMQVLKSLESWDKERYLSEINKVATK